MPFKISIIFPYGLKIACGLLSSEAQETHFLWAKF